MSIKFKIIFVSFIGIFFLSGNINAIDGVSNLIKNNLAFVRPGSIEANYNYNFKPSDSDNDGISDEEEIELGRDPHNPLN